MENMAAGHRGSPALSAIGVKPVLDRLSRRPGVDMRALHAVNSGQIVPDGEVRYDDLGGSDDSD